MTRIGMLHRKKNPKNFRLAYACAAVAKMMGVSFFYFSFDDVDVENKKINGKKYEKGSWKEEEFPFPDVIFNKNSPRNKAEKKINRILKKEIPFTSHPIGNKYSVYKRMIKSKQLAKYSIETYEIKDVSDVIYYLKQYKKIVLKPKKGSKGKEVVCLEVNEKERLSWIEKNIKLEMNSDECCKHIQERISLKRYIIQPFLPCKTKSGNPFDIRIHVQKNLDGEWVINDIYPRVGQVSGVVSNIHNGGFRGSLDVFLRNELPKTYQTIKQSIITMAKEFPSKFEELYEFSFDELGIDVGLDNEKNLKVFEVNWRPGCKYREFEAAQYHIQYAIFLARTHEHVLFH